MCSGRSEGSVPARCGPGVCSGSRSGRSGPLMCGRSGPLRSAAAWSCEGVWARSCHSCRIPGSRARWSSQEALSRNSRAGVAGALYLGPSSEAAGPGAPPELGLGEEPGPMVPAGSHVRFSLRFAQPPD